MDGRLTDRRENMDLGSLLLTIVIGFFVGLIAKFLLPGRDVSGFLATTAVGVVGSILATFGGQALGIYQPGQTAGFFGAVLGAILLLILLRIVRR
jgi:uncharacterized membrane protein YeaQ/YmgE (transglycosylase-associated protein family)